MNRYQQNEFEIRVMPMEGIKEEDATVFGHAAVFDIPSTNYDSVRKKIITEIFERGCFDETDFEDAYFTYNHQRGSVPAARYRKSGSSMHFSTDDKGLAVEARLNQETSLGKDIYAGVKSGDINKMSLKFVVGKQRWDLSKEIPERRILSVKKVFEVSAVDTAWHENTDIYARAAELLESEQRSLENEKHAHLEVEKLKAKAKIGGILR